MLRSFVQKGLIKARGKARTDSTHVLAAIHQLNRIECVAETLRHALNELASIAPEWLKKQVSIDWFDRYGSRLEQSRLPQTKQQQQQLALAIGCDGHQLLSAAKLSMTLTWLGLFLVIRVGKPKPLKVLTCLVFKLTGKLNTPSVLWDVTATPGVYILTIMTIL